jgi:hypothetical protein
LLFKRKRGFIFKQYASVIAAIACVYRSERWQVRFIATIALKKLSDRGKFELWANSRKAGKNYRLRRRARGHAGACLRSAQLARRDRHTQVLK